MTRSPLRTRLADAAYRALQRVLPRELRREFGDDMTQLFRDRRRAAGRSPWALGLLWLSALGDVARTAAGARRTGDARLASPRAPLAWVACLGQDVRFAMRLAVRERGFTLAAIAVLGLGISVASAAFMCVNTLLLKPLPGRPAGVVAGVFSRDTTQPGVYRAFSYDDVRALAAHDDVFADIAAHNVALAGLTDGDRTRQVLVEMVTANYFATFGAQPMIGRGFTEAEARPGSGADVALLSYAEWQRRGGRADILGQRITLNGRPLTIVGVTGPGFAGSLVLIAPPIWLPISAYDWVASTLTRDDSATPLADPATRQLIVVAQLRPGLTVDRVAPALQAMSAARALANPAQAGHESLEMAPLARLSISTKPQTNGPLESVAGALLVLGLIVLLIASLNVANMLLARAAARRREFAIRRAIGGGRARLVRQWLVEGLVLAGAGGLAGSALAVWAMSAVTAGLATIAPVVIDFDRVPDARVLAATCGFVVFAAIVFSVGPAWVAARRDPAPDLRAAGADASGATRLTGRNLLVTAQLALSVVMLAATAVFLRSAREAAAADPGFPVDRGLVLHLDAGLGGRTPADAAATYARLLERVRAEPGVSAASLSTRMPFDGFSTSRPVQRTGARLPADDPALVSAETVAVGADYFKTMGLTVRGREFSAGEEFSRAAATLAIIDEPLATRLFGADNALGRTIQDDGLVQGAAPRMLQVIGVVPGVRVELFDPAPVPHLYLAYTADAGSEIYLQLRTTAPTPTAEAARLPDLLRLAHSLDPSLPVLSAGTRASLRDRSPLLGVVRTGAQVFTAFGLCALVLAAAGVYAVKAYVVARRTREIGIRVALGATRASVLGLVAGDGLLIGAAGLAVGVGLALVAGRGLRSMTYAARGADLPVMAVVVVVLLVATTLAGIIPARRAARIDPSVALRE